VLAGVDQQLFVNRSQLARNCCGLHELRPITNDSGDSHVSLKSSTRLMMESRWRGSSSGERWKPQPWPQGWPSTSSGTWATRWTAPRART